MTAGVSHGRCVQRVCCSSWSCTPHLAGCPSIDDWSRPNAETDKGKMLIGGVEVGYSSVGSFEMTQRSSLPPTVIDVTVPPVRVELLNPDGNVGGWILLEGTTKP